MRGLRPEVTSVKRLLCGPWIIFLSFLSSRRFELLYKLFFAFEVFKAITLLILVSGRRFSYLSFTIQLDLHIPFVQPGQGVKLQLGSVAEFSIHRLWLVTAVTFILSAVFCKIWQTLSAVAPCQRFSSLTVLHPGTGYIFIFRLHFQCRV